MGWRCPRTLRDLAPTAPLKIVTVSGASASFISVPNCTWTAPSSGAERCPSTTAHASSGRWAWHSRCFTTSSMAFPTTMPDSGCGSFGRNPGPIHSAPDDLRPATAPAEGLDLPPPENQPLFRHSLWMEGRPPILAIGSLRVPARHGPVRRQRCRSTKLRCSPTFAVLSDPWRTLQCAGLPCCAPKHFAVVSILVPLIATPRQGIAALDREIEQAAVRIPILLSSIPSRERYWCLACLLPLARRGTAKICGRDTAVQRDCPRPGAQRKNRLGSLPLALSEVPSPDVPAMGGHSIGFCDWARAYYEQQRHRGAGQHTAVRALAFKDDSRYLQSLRQRGSPLAVH